MENQPAAPQPPQFPAAFTLFKPSLQAIKLNIWTFVALLLAPFAGFIIIGFINSTGTGASSSAAVILVIATVIFSLFVVPALTYVELQSAKGIQVSAGNALKVGMKYFWRFYGLGLWAGLMVLGGLILLIVPGIFMVKRYILSPYYLFDRDMKIRDAMRASKEDSKTYSRAIWDLMGVNSLLSVIGRYPPFAIIAFVGQVAYYCAPAIRYTQIEKITSGRSDTNPPAPTPAVPPVAPTPAA